MPNVTQGSGRSRLAAFFHRCTASPPSRTYICPLSTVKHTASVNMSDGEQQAPPQTQDEVKTENPDTINVKVHFPLLNVLSWWKNRRSDRCCVCTGSDIFGRRSVLQD